jgi:hypothetical protein
MIGSWLIGVPDRDTGPSNLKREQCSSLLWLFDAEIATDLPAQEVIDLAMTRHGRGLIVGSVNVDAMAAAFAQQ